MTDDTQVIDRFVHEYRFLSNFYPSTMHYAGEAWKTAEHAYQAAKTEDQRFHTLIRATVSPGQAKRLGRKAPLRPGWDEDRLVIMAGIVRAKFDSNMHLTQQLLATGHRGLIEGNNWGDTFWGVCNGVGWNHLGVILMRVRHDVRDTFYSDTGIARP